MCKHRTEQLKSKMTTVSEAVTVQKSETKGFNKRPLEANVGLSKVHLMSAFLSVT